MIENEGNCITTENKHRIQRKKQHRKTLQQMDCTRVHEALGISKGKWARKKRPRSQTERNFCFEFETGMQHLLQFLSVVKLLLPLLLHLFSLIYFFFSHFFHVADVISAFFGHSTSRTIRL